MYTGVTNNLPRRVSEHKQCTGPFRFAKRYKTVKLVWYERFPTMRAAIEREKQIKGWRREKKEWLINDINPGWDDLGDG